MRNVFASVLTIAGLGCYCVAGAPAAKADVIRIATVVAENQADYANNAALVPAFVALLKKASVVKATYSGIDAGKLTITTTSVWPTAADIKTVTDTADWKAAAGKLKYKTYTAEVFEVVP
jgi:hypothetical protein